MRQPDYYIYKGVRYISCPRGVRVVRSGRDAEGGYYAIVERDYKVPRLLAIVVFVLLGGFVLARTVCALQIGKDGLPVIHYTLVCPSEVMSYGRDYVYLGLQAGAENPGGIEILILNEDGMVLMGRALLMPSEVLGVVTLQQPLQDGAENYVLEVWEEGGTKKLGQKVVTIVYVGRE